MLNYIIFQNPPETYTRLPHAHSMICKVSFLAEQKSTQIDRKTINTDNIDYSLIPGLNQDHLKKVLEAKKQSKANDDSN